jgi:diadenosine tetraphosphate (Ap4A) HIT family hydrolase
MSGGPGAACPFCDVSLLRIVAENEFGFAIRDGFPISPGHTLIIVRRHVGLFFELSMSERLALLELLDDQKLVLDRELRPVAYNIGINDGAAAGQTVPHLHVHLIPRYLGDVPDPRGGVRWVLPGRAKYWAD